MTEKEIIDYWGTHPCDFYIELDKWLRHKDKHIRNDNDAVEHMYMNFVYFNTHKGIFMDDPVKQLHYWIENASEIRPVPEYDSSMWEGSLVLHACKEEDYDFFAPYDLVDYNIVKGTAKALGMTQKELSDAIGAAEATVRNWSAGKEIPTWAIKSMELLRENHKNKEVIDTLKKLKELIS